MGKTPPAISPTISRAEAEHDPAAYERACLKATRAAFKGPGHRRLLEMSAERLRNVELEGVYPQTMIVVTIENGPRRRAPERVMRYPVWGDPALHAVVSSGRWPSAALFGANVAGWAIES
jgi:hypothetical protein